MNSDVLKAVEEEDSSTTRRLAEDDAVDTFTITCVWVISLIVIAAVVLLDRYEAKSKREAMQSGQTWSWKWNSILN